MKVREVSRPLLEELHYLFSHENGVTVAHCLELDLVTSGNDIEDAEESLNALVLYQVSSCWGRNESQLDFKAPKEDWDILSHAQGLASRTLELDVPPAVFNVARATAIIPIKRAEQGRARA